MKNKISALKLIPFLLFTSCNHEKLLPLNRSMSSILTYGTVDAHFCTSAPAPAKQKLKYLFILDHSASNQPGFPLSAADIQNTDSFGSRRYGPLINFVTNLVPDPNNATYFSIINFNDTATMPAGIAGFDPDAIRFSSLATTDWIGGGIPALPAPRDSGFTNYQAALQRAIQLIRTDAQSEAATSAVDPVTSSYQIIFVTDGAPIVALGAGTYTQTFAVDIQPVIASMLALKNDASFGPFIAEIVLNTAYYFNDTSVAAAETLLQQMALEGNGQYQRFGSGRNVLYQQFAPPVRNIRNELVDVFIENKNGLWWDNGEFMLDSDGDGLPDLIELEQNSNPSLVDSDGNGVSDLIEYRTKGRACDVPGCAAIGRDRYAICSGFSPTSDSSGRVSFKSSTNDGFNDCEKYLLGASRTNYNTNGNLIPDQYAYKAGLPVTVGTGQSAFADPFGDGFSNYMKLKTGMPLQISKNTLVDFEQRGSFLTVESNPTPFVICYHLIVGSIALSTQQDTMKVMIIQNNSIVQNKPFLMSAERVLGPGEIATFLPGDFR